MTKEKKRSSALTGVILSVVLLALVVFLENSGLVPPTHILFTVLKKGAVYSLVAVSMNLLNGFTGLFSLGQAGFMLLGAYTYAILTVPTNVRDSCTTLWKSWGCPRVIWTGSSPEIC